MRIISQQELIDKLFNHPYDNNPDYHAAMSVVYLSDDGRLLIGYWHAPEGEIEIDYGINIEFNYVISGKIRLSCPDGTEVSAGPGDIIECGGDGSKIKYRIEEYAKTLFIVYPLSQEDVEFVSGMRDKNEKIKFERRRQSSTS